MKNMKVKKSHKVLGLVFFLFIFVAFVFVYRYYNKEQDFTKLEDKIYTFQDKGWKSQRNWQFYGNINYYATEVPIEYYIIKELDTIDLVKLDSIVSLNKEERIVEVEFQAANKKDILSKEFTGLAYEEGVKYMSFNIQNDFKVITQNHDTIACSGLIFERNFKVAPFSRAILFFGGIQPDESIQLIYNDKLFGNGLIKFSYKFKPTEL